MPKRPCSIALTLDEKTILSADKFGDVYSLPSFPREPRQTMLRLKNQRMHLPHQLPPSPTLGSSSLKLMRRRFTQAATFGLSGDQERERENRKRELEKEAQTTRMFRNSEHTLLLGHVSMLTSVIPASHGSRQYIITADRDEHIRVSRGIPHTHVIESYCLGHKDFVKSCAFRHRGVRCLSQAGEMVICVFGTGEMEGCYQERVFSAMCRRFCPLQAN